MRKLLLICMLAGAVMHAYPQQQIDNNDILPQKVLLPNGWSLTPVGNTVPLGHRPLNIAVSSSKKYLAVTNNGQSTQTLQLISVAEEKVLDSIVIPKSWLGLKFSEDEKFLYASGGNDNRILKYSIGNPSG